jgi:hypothetical protein
LSTAARFKVVAHLSRKLSIDQAADGWNRKKNDDGRIRSDGRRIAAAMEIATLDEPWNRLSAAKTSEMHRPLEDGEARLD